ncbi:hypothetical protein BC940DRAFT_82553 [Gongronella butleri]|nr:hypothetical protein BC940DRAFT_82553 [Gongronella butleri]
MYIALFYLFFFFSSVFTLPIFPLDDDEWDAVEESVVVEIIESHYESLVDAVLVSDIEDVLMTLSYTDAKQRILDDTRDILDLKDSHCQCLRNEMFVLGDILYDIHSASYDLVAPTIDAFNSQGSQLLQYMTEDELVSWMSSLNAVLLRRLQLLLDPKEIQAKLLDKMAKACHVRPFHRSNMKNTGNKSWADRIAASLHYRSPPDHRQQQLLSKNTQTQKNVAPFWTGYIDEIYDDLKTQMDDEVYQIVEYIREDML